VDPKTPSRPAAIGYVIVTVLLGLALATGVILTLLAVVGAVRGGHTIPLAREVTPEQLASLPPNVTPANDFPVTQEITDASPLQTLLRLASDLVPLLVYVPALWLLRGLVGSVRQGDPFSAANLRRLRALGFLILLGWPVAAFCSNLLQQLLAQTLPAAHSLSGRIVPAHLDLTVLAGLGVLVLAEVFAHGLRLREDVEGTI
jgi:Protein of unknown function (DUF2975)